MEKLIRFKLWERGWMALECLMARIISVALQLKEAFWIWKREWRDDRPIAK